MANVGWFLLAAVAASVYLAVVVATLLGAVRAFRERYLPPWVVGLVAVFLLMWFHELLGAPLGNFGGVVAVAAGIVAGAVYGLGRRRAMRAKPIS
jgi:chromate transport protein ChrA